MTNRDELLSYLAEWHEDGGAIGPELIRELIKARWIEADSPRSYFLTAAGEQATNEITLKHRQMAGLD